MRTRQNHILNISDESHIFWSIIFSTRSPHRPCPIGLSLVEIDHIVNSRIYFNGTDMVDGTPVLDLKPYIPRYDSPIRNRLAGIVNIFIQACILNAMITKI